MKDNSEWLEKVMNAGALAGETAPDLRDARCPKCGASDFVAVSDLYSESVGRIEDAAEPSDVERVGGMTDAQIVREFTPPRRRSATGITLAVAVPLGAAAYWAYRRFGDNLGQVAIVVAIVVTIITLLTKLRSYSDRYYHDRQRWNRMYLCRKCGQRIAA